MCIGVSIRCLFHPKIDKKEEKEGGIGGNCACPCTNAISTTYLITKKKEKKKKIKNRKLNLYTHCTALRSGLQGCRQ